MFAHPHQVSMEGSIPSSATDEQIKMTKKTSINFKNINKIFPKDTIKKMRQEDLIGFYVDNKHLMTQKERVIYSKKILGSGANNFPAGSELLVEKKGGRLSFLDILDADEN